MKRFLAVVLCLTAAWMLRASEAEVIKANNEYRLAMADMDLDKAVSMIAKNYRESGVDGKKMNYADVMKVVRMAKLAKKVSGNDAKLVDMIELGMLIQKQGDITAEQRKMFADMENTDAGKQLKQQLKAKIAQVNTFLAAQRTGMKAAWQQHKIVSCQVEKNRAKLVFRMPSMVTKGKTENIVTRWRKRNGKWMIYRSTARYYEPGKTK